MKFIEVGNTIINIDLIAACQYIALPDDEATDEEWIKEVSIHINYVDKGICIHFRRPQFNPQYIWSDLRNALTYLE